MRLRLIDTATKIRPVSAAEALTPDVEGIHLRERTRRPALAVPAPPGELEDAPNRPIEQDGRARRYRRQSQQGYRSSQVSPGVTDRHVGPVQNTRDLSPVAQEVQRVVIQVEHRTSAG